MTLFPLILILLESVIKPFIDYYWLVFVIFGFIWLFIVIKIINAEDERTREKLKKYLVYTIITFLALGLLAFSFKKIETNGSLEKMRNNVKAMQSRIETRIKCGDNLGVVYDRELEECTCSKLWYDYDSETKSCIYKPLRMFDHDVKNFKYYIPPNYTLPKIRLPSP